MTKMQWDESLILILELTQFFSVKDEDRKMVFDADGKIPPKTYILPKTAQKNDFDFNEIFEREFKETGLEENPENRENWRGRLIEDIQYKIDRHILLNPDIKKQSNELISKANSFIKFLIDMDKKLEAINTDEVYKTQILFKVGLLFAIGKMNKYFTVNGKNETVMNNGFTAPKIAKELENDSFNKYILASINNYTTDKENGNKNIFNSLDMMTKIISHCEAKNIIVDAYFKSRLPIE